MKLVRWVRFTWELKNLPELQLLPEERYTVRRAEREDAQTVHDVLLTAFTLDTDWNDTLHALRELFEVQIERAFDQKEVPCLILIRGARAVGASVLSFDPAEAGHLVTGPAIVNEFRNRGLGAALLYESLRSLRDGGLERAHGITKQNAPTAKFLYPKFGSAQEPFEFDTSLAGTSDS